MTSGVILVLLVIVAGLALKQAGRAAAPMAEIFRAFVAASMSVLLTGAVVALAMVLAITYI